MASTTIVFGLLLVLLGLAGYFLTGTSSVTALIPAFFGLLLIVLGFIARAESARKHAMHAAVALGLLGAIGALIRLIIVYSKTGALEGRGAMASGGMALVCAVFVALCVRSFIQVRKARRGQTTGSSSP